MRRYSDWPEKLAAEIEAATTRPFSYGRHDCSLFAADCILAMTGVDPAENFRRRYKTAEGAKRALKKIGSGTLLNTAHRAVREIGKRVPVALARRGDMVYARIPTDEGDLPALGVCVGATAAFASDGLVFHPMSICKRAWAIGWSDA